MNKILKIFSILWLAVLISQASVTREIGGLSLQFNQADAQQTLINTRPGEVDRFGWFKLPEVLTYTGSNAVSIATGGASRFQIGDKIRLVNNSTTKYFYIVNVTDTSLSITAGSDYSLANSAITEVYVSRASSPFNFPVWFNWSPSFTGFSVNPSSSVFRFKVDGRTCITAVRMNVGGTSNSTSFAISAPITSGSASTMYWGTATWESTNNGVALATPSIAYMSASSLSIVIGKDTTDAAWTNANSKRVDFVLTYEM